MSDLDTVTENRDSNTVLSYVEPIRINNDESSGMLNESNDIFSMSAAQLSVSLPRAVSTRRL